MSSVRTVFTLAAVACALAFASPVSAQSADWLTYGMSDAGQRFSPLTAINAKTIDKLQPAWSRSLGTPVSMEGTPIVKDGVMYVTTGLSTVWALDARTGAVKWTYTYEFGEQGKPCCGRDNRGVTLVDDMVVTGTNDAHLIALDAKTGAVRWMTEVAKWQEAYAITSPPVYAGGVVITGIAGGESPIRGFLAAYDPKTGKQVWRTYTVPVKGDKEYASWGMAPGKEPHGGPTWLPGTYDPQLDTVYWSTGNPNPDFDPSAFSGTGLLYTDSLLAISPKTGKIKWSYKWTPRNIYDYDGVNESVLVDLPIGGKIVKALAHADRNGYLFVLDRTNGKVIYVEPFLDKVTWAQIDRTTGDVHLNPEIQAKANAMQPFEFAPASLGGKNWQPMAYDPVTHVLAIPAQETAGSQKPTVTPDVPETGLRNTGTFSTPTTAYTGSVVAYDLTTGKQLWKVHTVEGQAGGVMIAGGLVFDSQIQGHIAAFDEMTGKLVWTSPPIGAHGGITAPPMTYAIGGKQYIAVEVGVGGLWPRIAAKEPYMKGIEPDAAVYVFAL